MVFFLSVYNLSFPLSHHFLKSQDTSEKAQDCETQFKAKRDFLMSGLPDLLKRQIAKKAAALDVYNAASTSFQRVVHVQQKDDGEFLIMRYFSMKIFLIFNILYILY